MDKPAYKTTEFWITLGTFISSGLFLVGTIGADTRDSISSTSSHVVESIALILAQIAVFLNYRKVKATKKKLEQEEAKGKAEKLDREKSDAAKRETKPDNPKSKRTKGGSKSTPRRSVEDTPKRTSRGRNRSSE